MENHTLTNWLIGLLGVSLGVGSIVSYISWWSIGRYFDHVVKTKNWNVPPDDIETITLYPILIGVLERLFFSILIAFSISGVAAGLVTWIAVKLVSGWNRVAADNKTWRRMRAFNGLINSLVSLLFAVVGGLIANGTIRIP